MAGQKVDIKAMSAKQRLALLEEIWDSLSPDEVPVSEAQRAELDRRLDELEQDNLPGIPWAEVQRPLRAPGK